MFGFATVLVHKTFAVNFVQLCTVHKLYFVNETSIGRICILLMDSHLISQVIAKNTSSISPSPSQRNTRRVRWRNEL